MGTYKKVNTQRIEQEVYQRNKDLGKDSTIFFVVAPENTTCFSRYMRILEDSFNSGDSSLVMKNQFHQAGSYYPDFQRDYRVYEISINSDDNKHITLSYERM